MAWKERKGGGAAMHSWPAAGQGCMKDKNVCAVWEQAGKKTPLLQDKRDTNAQAPGAPILATKHPES
eukprot:510761-Pelagomonas_calceolata.AAC.4